MKNDKSTTIDNERIILSEQHGNFHEVTFTASGFISKQLDAYYDEADIESIPGISVSYPTQSGTLVVDKDLDKFAIKDDVIKDLAIKLDANGWGVIPKDEA